MKKRSESDILEIIRKTGQVSQAKLAEITKKSPSTISFLMKNLKNKGLINSSGKETSTIQGGKRATLISLQPDAGYFGAIYVKNRSIDFILFDFAGKVVNAQKENFQELKLEIIIKKIDEILKEWISVHHPKYLSSTIIFSYVVDKTGNVALSNKINGEITEFKSILRGKYQQEIFVVNDANSLALYAHDLFKDKFKNTLNFLIYFEPFRIGCGIIIGRNLYYGGKGASGELLPFNKEDVINLQEKANLQNFLNILTKKIVSYALFLDCEAIVFAGDILKIGKTFKENFKKNLKELLKDKEIIELDIKEAIAKGSYTLAFNKYIDKLF